MTCLTTSEHRIRCWLKDSNLLEAGLSEGIILRPLVVASAASSERSVSVSGLRGQGDAGE